MGEPLARMDMSGEGVLADAVRRLERALQALEARVAHPPASPYAMTAQLVELQAVRERSRELELAAAEASLALGRAAAEVGRALAEDEAGTPEAQTSLFDAGLLEPPLEFGPLLLDEDEEAEGSAPQKESAA